MKRLMCGLVLLCLATACGSRRPPYVVPPQAEAPPPSFKEHADWKPARPSEVDIRGKWWEVYADPQLNALQERIEVSSETLKRARAQFLQARAAVGIDRANLYPQVGVNPSIGSTNPSNTRAQSSYGSHVGDFLLPVDVSYEADVWGRVRDTVASSRAAAQASAADLETVRLSLHAELATNYFALRGLDAEKRILDSAVAAFERALELTQNRFRGGVASGADVAQAETILETTRAQAIDVLIDRARLEHAIAALIGTAASEFSIPSLPLETVPPVVPAGLPSELLERRPDIAAAERRVAAANADLGVANAAYFPRLLMNASAGLESGSLAKLFTGASGFWSLGPTALVTAFDGGRRRAVSAQTRAAYDAQVAGYRDTVLRAVQEVEDQLAALRLLEQEAQTQQRAVDAAQRSLTLATTRYRGGVVTYLEVITAQSAALDNQRTAVTLLARRLAASVLLIKALGGGWNVATLPVLDAGRK
ncbi:MAG: efflux transporter outer membrane subunit [Vicinamibacterales bacterium]